MFGVFPCVARSVQKKELGSILQYRILVRDDGVHQRSECCFCVISVGSRDVKRKYSTSQRTSTRKSASASGHGNGRSNRGLALLPEWEDLDSQIDRSENNSWLLGHSQADIVRDTRRTPPTDDVWMRCEMTKHFSWWADKRTALEPGSADTRRLSTTLLDLCIQGTARCDDCRVTPVVTGQSVLNQRSEFCSWSAQLHKQRDPRFSSTRCHSRAGWNLRSTLRDRGVPKL